MSSPKTQPTAVAVEEFLGKITDEQTRRDCDQLVEILQAVVKEEPQMWGPSIVGFGAYHYVYDSGREGDCCLAGFSPRKHGLSLYLTCDIQQHQELLDQLGPHSHGKGCLSIQRLADVHLPTLKKLVRAAVKETQRSAAEMAKKSRRRSS